MKLRELKARFLKREVEERTSMRWCGNGPKEKITGPCEIYYPTENFSEADGIMFLCPLCFAKNSGVVGMYFITCWFIGKVPASTPPSPERWNPAGTGLDDLTLVPADGVSVHCPEESCGWHGHVTNGNAV